MATNIDLNLDASGGGLLIGGSAQGGVFPSLFRNDVYNIRLRILEEDADGILVDSAISSPSIKFGIGNIDEPPTLGQFYLTLTGPVTSTAISFDATNLQVLNAISGIAGAVTVSAYGEEDNAWLITAATANTAMSFGGDSGTLFPTSSVLISTRRFPAQDVKAQQVVKLRQTPSVYANNFTQASTSGVISLSKTQEGTATANETYRLAIGTDAIGGNYFLRYGSNSSTGIPIGVSAVSVSPIISAICGIGTGNISVIDLDGEQGFSIAFTGSLSNQNITTAFTLDATPVYYAKYYESLVTMGTAELDELFASTDSTFITPTIEIELSESSQAQTLYQGLVTIKKDLINAGAVIPATQESYYTKTEADSTFSTIVTINLNYYTKLEVDNLIDSVTGGPVTGDYYTKAQSDNRYPTTAAISASYYTKTDTDSRYPTTAAISASYYTKTDSDSRYPTTASISASYYTKTDSDARYPTTAAISASYYTKTETGDLFVEDSPSNVSASSRQLVNSATLVIIDWQSGLLGYSGVLQVPTATTASGVTISSVLNITTQTVVSGDLIVYGTISAGPISAGTYYTKTESDNRFVRNSTTGVYVTDRSLRDSGGNKDLEWGTSQVIIWESLVVTAGGTLGVDGSSTLEGQVNMLAGFAAIGGSSISNGSLLITNGGMTIESQSVSGTLVLGFNSINGPSANATLQDITCRDINCEDITASGAVVAGSISAGNISVDSVSTTTLALTAITVTTINVSCGFGFGGSVATGRYPAVTPYISAISINNSTAVTWLALTACSNGTPTTIWVFAGTGVTSAPSFLGYDEEVRKITRQTLKAVS